MPIPKKFLAAFEPGHFYHVYNRTPGGLLLFNEQRNYPFFLEKFTQYLLEFVDVYSYCLIPNHFHFLIKTKLLQLYEETPSATFNTMMINKFKNFFTSYANSFNTAYSRHGALFSHPFKRILVNDDHYLTRVIYYIHNNPAKHNIIKDFRNYRWSSYNAILSESPTNVCRKEIIEWFGTRDNFIKFHLGSHPESDISKFIIE